MIKKVLILILTIFIFTSLNAKINIKTISSNKAVINLSNFKNSKKIILILKLKNAKLVNPPLKNKPYRKSSIKISSLEQYSPDSYIIFNGIEANLELNLIGLKSLTKYDIIAFKEDIKNKGNYIQIDNNSFMTLAKEPDNQSKWIIFKDLKSEQITMFFKQGNGKRRLVVVSKGNRVENPKDGISYRANNIFGNQNSKVGANSYAVYNGEKNEITIKGLEYGQYTFEVFEYNGNGKSSNYLIKKAKQNPRTKWMPLPPPVALKAIDITKSGFTAKWEKVKGAQYYELDIAKDKKFTELIPFFDKMDVGNIDAMEVVELEKGDYYYRLKAVGKITRSVYSKIMKVTIK